MKKGLIICLFFVIAIAMSGCTNQDNGKAFKEEYESLNGLTNKMGKEHRAVQIDANNPFEKVSAKEIVKKIENKETFYVYFGDKLCPWCRSVIEKAVEVANKKGVEKIYYVAIWDDEGTEILRDKYEIKEGNKNKISDGTEEYEKLLKYFDKFLTDYTLTDSDGNKVEIGEKRIYAPNFIYVEDGKVVRLEEGISEKQTDSREELTTEMLEDEEELFEEFFE